MHRTAVIDVVGLSSHLITETETPFLHDYLKSCGKLPIAPVLPAVTTTVQSTYLTGKVPSDHGIVGNGWYSREDAEFRFWKQSNHLVQSEKVWDVARDRDVSGEFTVANSFWWYNMYSSVDYAVTPRPMYPADGRKLPDVYTKPPKLRDDLQEELGQFPLFNFWGPKAGIEGSTWIAKSAKYIEERYSPTLHLIYLPHLDYCLQKIGTEPEDVAEYLKEIDDVLKDLVPFLEERGIRCMLLSEYGISPVDTPIHINRALRRADLITVREELGRELLDAGACKAFAVADHQIAHIYINDPSCYAKVLEELNSIPGIEYILEEDGKRKHGISHPRAGDIVCVAQKNAWFTYYFWLDDAVAPDYARCVDIHRKPGYDPVELFVDPEIAFPMVWAGFRIAQKELGFRYLMDLIPLQANLVKGSHGAIGADDAHGALLITKCTELVEGREKVEATEVRDLILQHLGL